jgi:hypothetical protein
LIDGGFSTVTAVDFVDRIVVQLADPTQRAGLFDDAALESLLAAGYRLDGATGPFTPVFDELRLGLPAPPAVNVDGTWQMIGESKPTEVRLTASGFSADDPTVINGLWRGGIVARFAPAGDPVTAVFTAWPDLALLDRMVVAAAGNLPSGPALETARRTQLRALARTGMAGADPLTAADVDDWFARAGVSTVAELLARPEVDPTGVVRVTYAAPQPVVDTPRFIPVTVALLVRDASASITDFLVDSRRVRERLDLAGLVPVAKRELPIRQPVIVAWVVPIDWFDDTDWPGATEVMNANQRRAARRAAATAWLANEGVGLVAVTP